MLEVRNLSVDYSGIKAVDKVSIDVGPGAITALIGSNGAGKTSLLGAISGLIAPSTGTITFNGVDLTATSPAGIVAAGVVQVPEGRELFPRMTIQENLLLGAHLRTDKRAISRDMDRAYELFPVLARKRTLKARQLSGGEQQMLAFARAMMSDPKLYILDEPSIGLAPLIEEHLMRSIVQICKETGAGVLLVEQNAMLALEISTNAYVMELGSITLSGPSSGLLNNPAVAAAYLGQ
ncbi:ABC transporter ATP-binding protein [Phyllobacterium zundukense]|uniref:ABC transporter ATP-binding protein n=1 Tax=Phyllobacterium zundukense TaxID=1867719 RepID=A0ACD4CVH2_9HYPH|nr:ABC transporter ATP-binding protein [Phyllobacterium zundukense]UXN57554.1 ABC transporter ATP-binding protein [Phyllobacterium zundukense]